MAAVSRTGRALSVAAERLTDAARAWGLRDADPEGRLFHAMVAMQVGADDRMAVFVQALEASLPGQQGAVMAEAFRLAARQGLAVAAAEMAVRFWWQR